MKIEIDTGYVLAVGLSFILTGILMLIIFLSGCAPVPAIKSDFVLKKKYEVGAAGNDGRFNIMACDEKDNCYLIGSFVETK